jgi:hypothetical protein
MLENIQASTSKTYLLYSDSLKVFFRHKMTSMKTIFDVFHLQINERKEKTGRDSKGPF